VATRQMDEGHEAVADSPCAQCASSSPTIGDAKARYESGKPSVKVILNILWSPVKCPTMFEWSCSTSFRSVTVFNRSANRSSTTYSRPWGPRPGSRENTFVVESYSPSRATAGTSMGSRYSRLLNSLCRNSLP
jgi:hypothetical protein